MFTIDFSKPCRVYFIGIGGISMSGLAEILMKEGFQVSGSDMRVSDLTKLLESEGARIHYQQVADNIKKEEIDLVVFTAAIHEDHPELKKVRDLGIPCLTRADLLGQIMLHYKNAIAIAGTHGKTTTTSMVSSMLLEADMDPTITVGGILESIHGNFRLGDSDNFVMEACEYTNSFLSFNPTIAAVLNVEEDHLDFFKDINDIRHSFRLFMEKLPAHGLLVINQEIDRYQELTEGLACRILTFGMEGSGADYTACSLTWGDNACGSFTVCKKTEEGYQELTRIHMGVPGIHNVKNALAACAIADEMGVSPAVMAGAMEHFGNAKRRFEYKGTTEGGVKIVDDYAHHPQEISATLNTAGQMKAGKVWCVFQSHTYTRTKALLEDFSKSLSAADEVLLAPIYAARETDTLGVSHHDIARGIEALGTPVKCFDSFAEIEDFIKANCKDGDLVITMGAGDIYLVGEDLLK